MPEAALPRLDPERRERLAALGLELLALRAELATPVADAPAASLPTQCRLGVAGADWPSTDPLLRGIVAALGLRGGEVSAQPTPDCPMLRVGAAGHATDTADALALPSLAALRDARSKRALWPRLRRLRRRLERDRQE